MTNYIGCESFTKINIKQNCLLKKLCMIVGTP